MVGLVDFIMGVALGIHVPVHAGSQNDVEILAQILLEQEGELDGPDAEHRRAVFYIIGIGAGAHNAGGFIHDKAVGTLERETLVVIAYTQREVLSVPGVVIDAGDVKNTPVKTVVDEIAGSLESTAKVEALGLHRPVVAFSLVLLEREVEFPVACGVYGVVRGVLHRVGVTVILLFFGSDHLYMRACRSFGDDDLAGLFDDGHCVG